LLGTACATAPVDRCGTCCDPTWRADDPCGRGSRRPTEIPVTILGLNDFHGQLPAGKRVANRPVGGAAVVASWLRAAPHGPESETFLVHAGDLVGASPAASALLQDEPTISFLNLLARDPAFRSREDGQANVVGTFGNHEFDEGRDELWRLLYGGDHPKGPFLETHWRGAEFWYACANVFEKATGRTLVDPFVVRPAGHGLEIGFVGAVLRGTPSVVTPSGVAGLEFRDEAESINRSVHALQGRGVHAIVVLLHQGGSQAPYTGPTSSTAGVVTGDILDVVAGLDDDVDVVISGHTHSFTNALIPNAHGKPILVTEALSAGTAYADVRLVLDGVTGDVVTKSARIQTTWADEGPGLAPSADVAALVAAAEANVAPLVGQAVGATATAITRAESDAGESALGNLLADAERAATGTDFAFMNPGGIRADLDAGPVTWGELFAVQPFGNVCVKMTLTGAQVRAVLEQQWAAGQPAGGRILKTSGLTYTWSAAAAEGHRVAEILKAGAPLDPAASYTVTCNSFLADGGDGFTVFKLGTARIGGPLDLEALVTYLKGLPQPVSAAIEGRITRTP
jgi:5'-nucleotidase